MNEKYKMIKKILNNSFINLDNISEQEIIDFNLLEKLNKLDLNPSVFENIVKSDSSRIHSFSGIKYNGFLIKNDCLYYYFLGGENMYSDLFQLSKEYNSIEFKLIDELIEYLEDKKTITEIALFVKNMKK